LGAARLPWAGMMIECVVVGGVPRFIYSSTAAVYGSPAHVPVTEDDAVTPISLYGSSKLMTEIMRSAGLSHVILRYSNVAGADRDCVPGNQLGEQAISSRSR
jgi:UDP-glucose 4-epimerase